MPSATDVSVNDTTLASSPTTPLPQPILNIKKINLICRRPAQFSHPRQRPPPSKHGSSVRRFLTSYISIDDEDVDPSTLEDRAKEDAAIWERVELFRQQGRYIPGTDVLFGTDPDEITYVSPTRNTEDIWDQIIKEVVQKAKVRPRKPLSRQITSQIANKVQSHFDSQENKRNKAAQMEIRRLQVLAKSTVKLVVAEWKKAVFVRFFTCRCFKNIEIFLAYSRKGATSTGGRRAAHQRRASRCYFAPVRSYSCCTTWQSLS